jgi:type I restriction enzyme R subunit
MIRATNPEVDLSAVLDDLQAVLDRSITPLDYIIREDEPLPGVAEARVPYRAGGPESLYRPLDLSQLDFEALARQFQTGYQHTEVEKLRGAISRKLGQMIRLNRTRLDYQKQFQQLIDDYNRGSRRQEETFAALLALAQSLTQEEQRHLAEGLSEEELALFDLLLQPPELGLSPKERQEVKGAVQSLLAKVKEGRLGLDWRKRPQAQAQVLVTIKDILDEHLPPAYTPDLYEQKCEQVYQHLYEHYYDDGGSAYTSA